MKLNRKEEKMCREKKMKEDCRWLTNEEDKRVATLFGETNLADRRRATN